MKTVDIAPLVTGVLTIIGVALATGQYGKLESWARHQAIEALQWKHGLPYIFPREHARHPRPTSSLARHK